MKHKMLDLPGTIKQNKRTLAFPTLASLTLAACGGGGSLIAPAPTNKAPTTAGTTTLTLDEDSTDVALGVTSPTDADGDNLTITVTGLPTGGALTTADGTEVTNNMTLTISQLTSLIFTPDPNLNIDNTDFGAFTYSVSDGKASTTGTVNISVTPVNDAPEFTSGPDINIQENHSDVTGFTATDIDNDALTYSISGGTEQTFFTIDAVTGALTFIDRPDFENPNDSDSNNIYVVEITIDDGNGGSATQTFNIVVSDVVTGISISNSSVDENISGAMVGDLTAAIDDINATHEYSYTLSGSDIDKFEVVDGQLKLKDGVSFNYEVKSSYSVTVTATDSGGLSISSDYTVTINDVNEAPTDINISRTGFMDNTDAAVVGTLTTDDEDTVDNHTYIVSDDRFEVVDGVLRLKAGVTIDNLVEPTVTINVTTTDKGGLTYQEEFTLTVGTVQVTATQFEENAVGAVIGNLSVIDTSFSGNITYTLSGEGSDNFEVVAGQLKLKDTFSANYEVLSSYQFTIIATDDTGHEKSTTHQFTVIDVNDAPTSITLSSTAINENSAGAIVGDLTTTDEDISDSHTYTLTGDDADSFEVVDGQLKLQDNVSANYEVKNSYSVTVTATDSGGLSISSDYTVTINDVNDAPSAMNISGSLYVNDGTTGGVVGDVTTDDEDAGDSHIYTLSGTNAVSFEIVNGQLKLKDNITADYSMISAYSVTVTSTDIAGATISENYTVEVNVAPTFVNLGSNNVDENYVSSQVGALTVIDGNTNDEFTYTISGDGAESFEVVNGQLMVKNGTWLDYETQSNYTLTITVTDQGGYSLEKTLTIDVNDVDYGNPWFSEHVSVYDMPMSNDIGIYGQQWFYNWEDGSQPYSLRFEHDDDPNTPLVITYSLMNANAVLGDNYDDGYEQGEDGAYSNIENYSAEWEAAVDAAFEYWGNVSGITFVKVDDNANMCGDIRIALSSGDFGSAGGWSNVPYYYQGENNSTANDIWIRSSYDQWGEDWPAYNLSLLLHEIGHSLGLSHTHHDYYSAIEHNTSLYSVMSYIGVGYLVNPWPGYEVDYWVVLDQPAINDIKTIQYLYGMTPEYNHGNTSYTYTGPVYTTIYDTGGIDTIDVSNYGLDITLDLRGGMVSYIGTAELELEVPYGNGSDDYTLEYSGFPIGIAEGTVIENATTGSGDDIITCNTAINTITCGSGNDDVLLISSGDIVFGGHGYDNFYINSFDFNLIDGGVGTDVTDGEGDGLYFHGLYSGSVIDLRAFTDNQITNIEDIYIDDGKVSVLKISALALRNLEGSYLRDMDGDGDLEFVYYIYADADLDEVQVNAEGWSLSVPIDTGDNVYSGYDYYFLSGTLFESDIWFAVNTGTTVTYINESGESQKISPDRSNDEIIIVDNKNPMINVDDSNTSIPVIEPINIDPFNVLCASKYMVSPISDLKSFSFSNISNHLDMTSDLLIVEDALDYSILLPEIGDIETEKNITSDSVEIANLLIFDPIDIDLIFFLENFSGDDILRKPTIGIIENNHDIVKEYDLFFNFEESIFQEDLIYSSELG